MNRGWRDAAVIALLAGTAGAADLRGQMAANDYGQAEAWLCRPGRTDACAIDQTTTVVAADGTMTRETWAADPRAPIDCFYVYPTVSLDPTPNSDMTAGEEERNVIRQQFARFASVCRPFAPLYRQVSLAGLRAAMAGGGRLSLDEGTAYQDVRDAWLHYLTHDNGGRRVALIGHSQGAMILMRLIREEIDGGPVQKRLAVAILLGANVAVPRGQASGGAFRTIPLCRSARQPGCVIAFASFRSTLPPPPNTLFGRVAGEGMEAACTNPASLAGGRGALHAYLTGAGRLIAGAAMQNQEWVAGKPPVDTPFVSVPGLLTAECVSNGHGSYLEVTVNGDPADPRADDIPGDLGAPGKVQASWGLHLIDVNLVMGNLVDAVRNRRQ